MLLRKTDFVWIVDEFFGVFLLNLDKRQQLQNSPQLSDIPSFAFGLIISIFTGLGCLMITKHNFYEKGKNPKRKEKLWTKVSKSVGAKIKAKKIKLGR